MPLPENIRLEVVTPEGLLLREEVDEVIAPGADGYFGVRPGHTPMLASLGAGSITYPEGCRDRATSPVSGAFARCCPTGSTSWPRSASGPRTSTWPGPSRRRHKPKRRLKHLKDEAGYEEAHLAYIRAVTRLSVAARQRQP